MASLRPFNTSTKTPKSVKLKGFNSDKNVTQQLEIDSRRMEEKLYQLKMTMNREKQERQSQGRGNIWASGRASGTLTAHGSEILNKQKPTPQKPSKPADRNKVRKVKVLKDAPLDIPERPKANDHTTDETRFKKKSFKGPACGQCESKPVSLSCMECGENYCTTCFAKFHLKGALRNHRSVPYQSPSEAVSRTSWDEENNNQRVIGTKRPETPKSNRGSTSNHSDGAPGKVIAVKAQQDPSPDGGSLLQGEYNEAESAASFAAALAEWRNSKKQDGGGNQKIEIIQGDATMMPQQSKPEVHDMGVGDTSMLESNNNLVEIKFSDSSLSYADKLLLKKHRRTEIPSLSSLSPTSHDPANPSRSHSENLLNGSFSDLGMNGDMQEEHERFVQIFSRNSRHPAPSDFHEGNRLVITELLESEGDNLEVQSVYSVEEVSAQPVQNGPQTDFYRECEVSQIVSPDDLAPRKSEDHSSGEKTAVSLNSSDPVSVPSRGLDEKSTATSTQGSNQPRSGEIVKQKVEESAKLDDNSSQNSARGLTKNPSEDLKRVINLDNGGRSSRNGQHRYTDGLGRFFMAGLGEDGSEEMKSTRDENLSNKTVKCSYQGPGVWRPSSSVSIHNEDAVVHVPSPPKQTKERKSSSASSRRKQSGTKKKEQVGDNTISWTLSEHPPPGVGGDGIHSNVKRSTSSSGRKSASSLSKKLETPRSASRIEIEGDDFARFDEDNGQQVQDAADEETLEELTWELASQSGRVSADGRYSSLSLQEVEPYIKNNMFASSLDEELGIVLDDGHGSGLSTPYDDIAMERLSEEDLQADFEEIETERDKQAVEDLDNF